MAPQTKAPFYVPDSPAPAGTALSPNPPTIFTPLKIRNLTLKNRIVVSPMCTYCAEDGHLSDWHLVHLGQFALRGAGLVFVEATAVLENGRITPQDSGLWKDSQIAPLKRIVDYVHSQRAKAGIQLAHAGRKASTRQPWLAAVDGRELATKEELGWEDNVWAPSPIPFADDWAHPKEMTVEQIQELVRAYAVSAKRALEAGFDVIEIHAAHGYLLTEFLSPITNQRTDSYGGSFENRTRVLFEVIAAVRSVVPEDFPVFVRVSSTEWMEYAGAPSWDEPSTVRLAKLLTAAGVDLVDVSSGGNNPAQKILVNREYQVSIAGRVRAALRQANDPLLVGAVGLITEAEWARDLVQDGRVGKEDVSQGIVVEDEHGGAALADVVLVARQFLREPEWVMRVAHKLGVKVQYPIQYHRAEFRRDQKM